MLCYKEKVKMQIAGRSQKKKKENDFLTINSQNMEYQTIRKDKCAAFKRKL